jgi:hypothetical protein
MADGSTGRLYPRVYRLSIRSYQRPYQLSILSQGKYRSTGLSILHQKVQVYRLSILPIGKTQVYWLFILLGKLKYPSKLIHKASILNGGVEIQIQQIEATVQADAQ